MKKQRVTRVLVASLTGALLLSGCGRSDDPAAEQTDQGVLETPLAEIEPEGTLTVWAMGAEGEKLPELVEDFEALYPDVTVEVTPVPWASAHDKLQTAIAAGNVPDISQVGTTWMADFANGFDAVPADLDLSGIFEGSVETAEVDGTAVGVPWYVDTRVVYYRTDLAAEAGWDTAPADWDELRQFAEDLQALDGVDYGIRLPSTGTDAYLNAMFLAWSNGASLTNEDQTEWTLDTPEMVEAFEYLQSYFVDGVANVDADTSPGASIAEFVSGSVPVFIDGPSARAQLDELGGERFAEQYQTAVLPTKESSTSFVGGSNLAVFEEAKNKEAAWKFIEWLTQPEVQVKWFELTTDLPSNEAA